MVISPDDEVVGEVKARKIKTLKIKKYLFRITIWYIRSFIIYYLIKFRMLKNYTKEVLFFMKKETKKQQGNPLESRQIKQVCIKIRRQKNMM